MKNLLFNGLCPANNYTTRHVLRPMVRPRWYRPLDSNALERNLLLRCTNCGERTKIESRVSPAG